MNRSSTVMILGESWRFGNLPGRATTILNRLKHSGVNRSAAGMSRSGTVDESCRHRRSIVRHRIDAGFSSFSIPIHPDFTD